MPHTSRPASAPGHFLAATGLLVAALGAGALTAHTVTALQGTSRAVAAEGPGAPSWVSLAAAGLEQEPLAPQGLTPHGTIDPDRGQVMWYTGHDRVVPGQVGTAVVAAHLTYHGQPDVFHDLPRVSEGDLVTIGYGDGGIRDFVVTDTQQLSREGLQRAPVVWDNQAELVRVALVTCDESRGHEADGRARGNVVVIAEAVDG